MTVHCVVCAAVFFRSRLQYIVLHTGPITTHVAMSLVGWLVGWLGGHSGDLLSPTPYDERYGVGLNRSYTGKCLWAIDWHRQI